MTTTTTTTNKATANNNGFATLLREYEQATRNRNGKADTEKAYTTALQSLATACVFSVLKKLCNVGGAVTENTANTTDTAKAIRTLRQSLAKDLHELDCLAYASNNATALVYTKDGDTERVIKDKNLYNACNELCATALGDGLDLVNTAIIAIMTETDKATDLTADFMETPYTVRRLKRKVYIKEADSVGGYETVTTTAIQEVYKAIRRDIENNRAMQVASNKYTYIESIATDTDSDTTTEIYRRLPKYSGLAYEMYDVNGHMTAITADTETVKDVDTLITNMNLTTKQAKILQLRLSGHGYKAIATYLGVTQRAVAKTVQAIQAKAIATGLLPNWCN